MGEHWYDRDGTPRYGSTKAVAMTRGYVPSVTTILGVIRKPGLESWKYEQYIKGGLACRRNTSPDKVMQRVNEDMSVAASVGTAVHNTIENVIPVIENRAAVYDKDPLCSDAIVDGFTTWYVENECESSALEVPVVSSDGFGGKVDFIGRFRGEPAIIDYKTQGNTSRGFRFYREFGWQLAGYWSAILDMHSNANISGPAYRLVSAVVATDDPGKIRHKVWDDNYLMWRAFHHAFELWKVVEDYDPAFNPDSEMLSEGQKGTLERTSPPDAQED